MLQVLPLFTPTNTQTESKSQRPPEEEEDDEERDDEGTYNYENDE